MMIADAISSVDWISSNPGYGPVEIAPASATQTVSEGNRIARIVDGTRTTGFPAVAELEVGCTGTLISPTHVLTAAHCTEGIPNNGETVTVAGQEYQSRRIYIHPRYNSRTLANDVSIIELRNPVRGVTPETLYRQQPRVGQQLTLVGFGAGGTGSSGHNDDFGIKRVGRTDIERVTATEIQWTFDRGESNTAPGDSGGPAFVTVNGKRYLAGVTSGGSRDDAGFGDRSANMRVDAYASWIDSIVGKPNPNPEPSDDHGNSRSTATALTLANGVTTVDAILEQAGDRDFFAVNIKDDSDVSIALTSTRGDVDTYLRLYDSRGRLVAQNDDVGNTTNSQLNRELSAGRYYISAAGYEDKEEGNYKVSVKAIDKQTPQTDSVKVDLNRNGYGRVDASLAADQIATFTFDATRTGQTRVQTAARTSNLDTVMRVLDSRGRVVATNDDYGSGLNSRVYFRAVAGQRYTVQITDYNEAAGNFRLYISNRGTLPRSISRMSLHDDAIRCYNDDPGVNLDWVR